jgi:hypothetical protein
MLSLGFHQYLSESVLGRLLDHPFGLTVPADYDLRPLNDLDSHHFSAVVTGHFDGLPDHLVLGRLGFEWCGFFPTHWFYR